MKERFFQYGDVSGDKRAEAIAGLVWEFLEDCACTNKVIAQCYDGTAVMAPGLKGVQAKIKEIIPQALFVHCYAHSLNLVMPQSAAKMKKCKIFFSHLSGLTAFLPFFCAKFFIVFYISYKKQLHIYTSKTT